MQTEKIVSELLKQAEEFMQVSETDSVVFVVSPETFAEIAPALSNIKHDKNCSSGYLGRHYVKADIVTMRNTDKALVCKPMTFEDSMELERQELLCL